MKTIYSYDYLSAVRVTREDREGGDLVKLCQRHGSLSFVHEMTLDQSRELALALIEIAAQKEATA